jgi:hypothetical protein
MQARRTFDVSVASLKSGAKLGGWEGKIKIHDDFFEPLADFAEYMK